MRACVFVSATCLLASGNDWVRVYLLGERVLQEAGFLIVGDLAAMNPGSLPVAAHPANAPFPALTPNVAPDLPLDLISGSSMAILGPHRPNPYTTLYSEAPPMLPLAPAAGPTA